MLRGISNRWMEYIDIAYWVDHVCQSWIAVNQNTPKWRIIIFKFGLHMTLIYPLGIMLWWFEPMMGGSSLLILDFDKLAHTKLVYSYLYLSKGPNFHYVLITCNYVMLRDTCSYQTAFWSLQAFESWGLKASLISQHLDFWWEIDSCIDNQ